jgi:hypothetical protein
MRAFPRQAPSASLSKVCLYSPVIRKYAEGQQTVWNRFLRQALSNAFFHSSLQPRSCQGPIGSNYQKPNYIHVAD